MAFALSLYSRPKVIKTCIEALMERLEGQISQEELEKRMSGLEDRQLPLFNAPRPPLKLRGGAERRGSYWTRRR